MPSRPGVSRPRRTVRAVRGPLTSYLATLAVAVTLIFALPRAVPGDPLDVFLNAEDSPLGVEERARLASYYGLDRSLPEQFVAYLGRVTTGDLGTSIAYSTPVSTLIRQRLPWTLLLSSVALILSSVIGFLAGMEAAWRRGTRRDRGLVGIMTALHAFPDYVIATFLLVGFGVLFPLFPLSGGSTPFTADAPQMWKLLDVARHLVLPGIALTLGLLGTKFLLLRNTAISVLGQDYMLLARAKGLPDRLVKYRHAGRNALLPFLAVLGVQAGFAFGGSLFVETVFGYPGIASLIQPAVRNLDFPLVEGCFLLLTLVVLTANLVVDLVSAALDPRVETA